MDHPHPSPFPKTKPLGSTVGTELAFRRGACANGSAAGPILRPSSLGSGDGTLALVSMGGATIVNLAILN
jgi:hypothetical protein